MRAKAELERRLNALGEDLERVLSGAGPDEDMVRSGVAEWVRLRSRMKPLGIRSNAIALVLFEDRVMRLRVELGERRNLRLVAESAERLLAHGGRAIGRRKRTRLEIALRIAREALMQRPPTATAPHLAAIGSAREHLRRALEVDSGLRVIRPKLSELQMRGAARRSPGRMQRLAILLKILGSDQAKRRPGVAEALMGRLRTGLAEVEAILAGEAGRGPG